MKIDELIEKHKEKLDVEQAPDDLWKNIRNEWKSDSVKKKSLHGAWKVAATVLLAFSFGLLFYTWSLRQQIDELASLGDISKEYASIEKQYQSEIKQLETTIPLKQINQGSSYDWLMAELRTLDEVNKMYRADIGKVGNEEQLIHVLMDYYEKKIKLLKKLELEIRRGRKYEEENETDIKI